MLAYAGPRFSRDVPPKHGLAGLGTVSLAAFAVVACQVVAVAAGVQTGAILNACLVAGLALAASAGRGTESSRTAYLLLSLLPLLALSRLVMPQNSFRSDLWELVVALPLVAGSIVFVFIVNPTELWAARSSASLRWQLVIASLGVPTGLFVFGIAYGLGERGGGSEPGVVPAVVLFVAGVVDELVFRGVLQRSLEPIYGNGAFIIAALLYTAMLLGSSAVAVAFGGLLGLVFGYLVMRRNVLLAVAVAHGLVNVVWLVVAPDVF
jgi:membrane protease YdiL (CAAX protease family)